MGECSKDLNLSMSSTSNVYILLIVMTFLIIDHVIVMSKNVLSKI